MTTSFKGLLVGLVALPVILSFQNCSGVQFSGAGARLVAKGDTTGTDPAINFVDSSGAPVIDLGDGGSSVPMNVPPADSGSTDGADSSDTTQDGSTNNGGDTADHSNDSTAGVPGNDPNEVQNPEVGNNPEVVANPGSTTEGQDPTRPGKNPPCKNPDVVKNENHRPEHPAQNENPDGENGMFYVCVLEGPGRSQLLHFEDMGFNSRVSMPQAVCTTKFACESLVSQKFSVKLAHKRGACGRNPHMVNLSELEIMSLLGL